MASKSKKKVGEKDTPDLGEYDFSFDPIPFFGQFTPESLVKATDTILEGLAKFPDASLLSCGLAWDPLAASSQAST
ncbi:hypothetical protein [Mesorhizobium sp. M0684]|uniref:hypothetical protein n=1 Tax=unclassified Mesorhizobium TaxID=325217 RepID=UPI00333D9AFE